MGESNSIKKDSGGYPLFRAMAKDLIQGLLPVHTVEAASLTHKLVRLSATLRDWSIENPPPASEKHQAVNEMIEAILSAQEMLKYRQQEDFYTPHSAGQASHSAEQASHSAGQDITISATRKRNEHE